MTNESSIELQHTRIVLRSAIASRLLLIALIILWRSLLRPYDTSASINPTCLSLASPNSPPTTSILFPRIASAIEDSIVWDSVYFLRIAQCGYEYEQSYAFFPLLPLCISLLSRTVFAPLIPLIGYRAVLGLSGYAINNIAFVLAAICLYIYNESLYPLLSIGGLYQLMSGASNVAALMLALSAATRSNGVINAGYMHKAYDAVFCRRHFYLAVQVLAAGALRCLRIFIPFIAFQAYGYYNICVGCVPDQMSPWCKVATRFLSARPPVYWFASHLMASPRIGKRVGYLIWAYCAAYILLGSLLFSNFHPFT